jgi:hypothetical protein
VPSRSLSFRLDGNFGQKLQDEWSGGDLGDRRLAIFSPLQRRAKAIGGPSGEEPPIALCEV